jgi:hypothetical protein
MWKNDRAATCEVFSHQLGWELRLIVGPELVQSQVVRTEPALATLASTWRAAMATKGWTEG